MSKNDWYKQIESELTGKLHHDVMNIRDDDGFCILYAASGWCEMIVADSIREGAVDLGLSRDDHFFGLTLAVDRMDARSAGKVAQAMIDELRSHGSCFTNSCPSEACTSKERKSALECAG